MSNVKPEFQEDLLFFCLSANIDIHWAFACLEIARFGADRRQGF
jgi:hypothetical protein